MDDNLYAEMTRYRELTKEMGREVDALQLACEVILRYRTSIAAVRLERDRLRRQLLANTWSG